MTLEAVLSRVRGLDKWELFHNLLLYLCMMLDSKMAEEAGEGSARVVTSPVTMYDQVSKI